MLPNLPDNLGDILDFGLYLSVSRLGYETSRIIAKVWRSCSWGSESNPNFQVVNKPSQISPHDVLQLWLINTVYHLLVKNKSGEGRGALNRGFTVYQEHLFQAFCVTTYSRWSESTSIFLHERRHAPCIVMSSIFPSLSILTWGSWQLCCRSLA